MANRDYNRAAIFDAGGNFLRFQEMSRAVGAGETSVAVPIPDLERLRRQQKAVLLGANARLPQIMIQLHRTSLTALQSNPSVVADFKGIPTDFKRAEVEYNREADDVRDLNGGLDHVDATDHALVALEYGAGDRLVISQPAATTPLGAGNPVIVLDPAANITNIDKFLVVTLSPGVPGVPAQGEHRRIIAVTPGVDYTVDTPFTDLAGIIVADTGAVDMQIEDQIITPLIALNVNRTQVDLASDPSTVAPNDHTIDISGALGTVTDYSMWVRVVSGPGKGQVRKATASITPGPTTPLIRLTLTPLEGFDDTSLPTTASKFALVNAPAVNYDPNIIEDTVAARADVLQTRTTIEQLLSKGR
jgi:hypothetical protein